MKQAFQWHDFVPSCLNSPFSQLCFPLAVGERPEQHISAYNQNNQLSVVWQYFTNIAAIQSGRYYNKFDSMKSLGVYYGYVKMAHCGCVEHGLEYITFYVQKHIAHLVACSGPQLVCDRPLGAPTFVKVAYWKLVYKWYINLSF